MLTRTPSPFPVTVVDERRLDRRRFLGAAGAAGLTVIIASWLARRVAARIPSPASLVAAELDDLPHGEVRVLTRSDGETLAVRLGDGSVAAFDRRCPHLGCPIVWSAANGRFECPCHHAAFDARTGRVLFGPPRSGLTPISIRTN